MSTLNSKVSLHQPETTPDPWQSVASSTTVSSGLPSTIKKVGNTYVPTTYEEPKISPVIAKQVVGAALNTQSRQILAGFSFAQSGALKIGSGSPGVMISPNGITAKNSGGHTTFSIDGSTGNATFMGTVAAGSIITGYLAVGGAAADVNSGTTTINGGQITAGTITANKLSVSTLSAISANLGTITAGSITAAIITTGTLNVDRIGNGSITGGTGGKLASSTITDVNIASLNADKLTAGTITVGGANAPQAILLRRDSNNSNTFLRWEGGTRIWADGSNRLGINSIGSPMYIYVGSNERFIIPSSGQTTLKGGLFVQSSSVSGDNGHLNVQGNVRFESAFTLNRDRIRVGDSFGGWNIDFRNQGMVFYRSNPRNGIAFDSGANFAVHDSSNQFYVNGTTKTAIVPTSKGFNALYCIESPEVWFVDFVEKIHQLDPMFEEVTEGAPYYIPALDENMRQVYQVWRRRRGHSHKRFETKNYAEFEANEQFLSGADAPVTTNSGEHL